jgi:hypothetical protein
LRCTDFVPPHIGIVTTRRVDPAIDSCVVGLRRRARSGDTEGSSVVSDAEVGERVSHTEKRLAGEDDK